MDTSNGRIYAAEAIAAMEEAEKARMRPMQLDPTPKQLKKGRVGRNDPCPCGSKRKFKKCCLWRSASNG